jgi:hypothetical protein
VGGMEKPIIPMENEVKQNELLLQKGLKNKVLDRMKKNQHLMKI